jgi:hypothetical protein
MGYKYPINPPSSRFPGNNIKIYCDVAAAQINYPSLNKQDNTEQVRGRSHEEGFVQIFMLYDMQLGGLKLSMLCYSKQKETINAKSNKTEIYQENKSWSQVNVYLQKSELIMETKRQFILRIFIFVTLIS